MRSKVVHYLLCLFGFVITLSLLLLTPKVLMIGAMAQEQDGISHFCGMEFVTGRDLTTVRSMGVTVVLQTFPHDSEPDEWVAQLDRAQRNNLRVIAWLWPVGWEWDGRAWQIDDQARSFIKTVAAHPATLAVYALHEPYWRGCPTCGLTTAQQQALYQEIKAIADIPIYSEIGSIAYWVDQGKATRLADGMCDYCGATYYPFFADGTYDREEFIHRLEEDLAAIRRFAPNSKLIWAMQVYAISDHPQPRRMPTAEEIADIGAIVAERDVDGIFWYVWEFGSLYDDFLSNHPELFSAVAGVPMCAEAIPPSTPTQAVDLPTNAPDISASTTETLSSTEIPLPTRTPSGSLASPSATVLGESTEAAAVSPTDVSHSLTKTAAPGVASSPPPTLTPNSPQDQESGQAGVCGLPFLVVFLPLIGCVALVRFSRR